MSDQKRPGRKPLREGDTTTPFTVRLPSRDFDRACQRAARERVEVRDLVRRGLSRLLDEDDDE
jgi:hypothetical protein